MATAETADAGLARLEEQPFDLLLLDVSLPDRSGLDLLPEIHLLDPTLPVVLITAYGSIDMARRAFKSGAHDTSPNRGRMTNCSRRWRWWLRGGGCARKTCS